MNGRAPKKRDKSHLALSGARVVMATESCALVIYGPNTLHFQTGVHAAMRMCVFCVRLLSFAQYNRSESSAPARKERKLMRARSDWNYTPHFYRTTISVVAVWLLELILTTGLRHFLILQ